MRRCPDPDSAWNLIACDAELRTRDLQESSGRHRGLSCLCESSAEYCETTVRDVVMKSSSLCDVCADRVQMARSCADERRCGDFMLITT